MIISSEKQPTNPPECQKNMKKQENICILLALALLLGAVLYLTRPAAPVAFALRPISEPDGAKLNINTADRAALEDIPGIGPVLADAILTRRAELGGSLNRDALLSVNGIGESRLAALECYITY